MSTRQSFDVSIAVIGGQSLLDYIEMGYLLRDRARPVAINATPEMSESDAPSMSAVWKPKRCHRKPIRRLAGNSVMPTTVW
jgi:hypothetical protein